MAEVVEIFGGRSGPPPRDGAGGPSPDDLAAFPLNDIGNAMRLILLAGGRIDRASGHVDATEATLLFLMGAGWVGFNGVHWDRKFGEDLARKLGHQVAHKLPGLWDSYKAQGFAAKDFFKFATDAGSAGKTSAMLRQAQSYLTVEIDAFDRDPLALTCLNGTLKMRFERFPDGPDEKGRRGRFSYELLPHDPADRITRCCAAGFDREAPAPLFDGVVKDSLPDLEERAFFKRLLGYAATGRTEEQAFFLCQGPGQDGKSTILDACREALGSYGVAASPDTFLEGGMRSGSDASPDLIALSGDTRLAVLSEPKRGAKLNEGLLKAWTSGSPIAARDLHSKPINFRPKAKLIFECNSLPAARGDDDGIWRRIKFSLFRRKVPDAKLDRLLPDKLRDGELPGVLNWLVQGVGDWLQRGKLDPPESLNQVVDEFRKASSPFGDWLSERCVIREAAGGMRTLVGDLYRDFKEWCEGQGIDRVMSAKAFGDAMTDRQILVMGKNAKGLKYRGPIRLKTPQELDADAVTAEAEGARALAASGPTSGVGDPWGGNAPAAPSGDPFDPSAFDAGGDEPWGAS